MWQRPKNNSQSQEDWQAIAERFYEMKVAQSVAPRTLSEHRYHIDRLFNHTGASMSDCGQLRRAVTRYFAESCQDRFQIPQNRRCEIPRPPGSFGWPAHFLSYQRCAGEPGTLLVFQPVTFAADVYRG